MKKGSILNKIAKDVSLSDYVDDTPLTTKVDSTLRAAIPGDVYEWFMGEIAPPPLSGSQGKKLIRWLFKNVARAEINLANIKEIRKARHEQFVDIIRENMPTPATMAHVTKDHLQGYNIPDDVRLNLVPYLAKTIKRDEEAIQVSIQWSAKAGLISEDDLIWMMRYCKPVSEYTQLLLI